jgi:putative CocE/NonD family hydrolase
MRFRLAFLAGMIAVLGSAGTATAAPGTGYSRPAQYGVHLVKDQTVRMSDGVELAADVYYPADPATGGPAAGPFPVVLAQTPYGKRSTTTTQSFGEHGGDGHFPYLVRRGYINAVVDVRGTGSSDGEFGLFSARDAGDGVELVRWASRLERSSGKVGAAGYSYVGLNQIHTAAAIGPGSPLKAIVPSAAGFDLYRDLAFGGGIPNAVFAGGWAGLRASMVGAPPDDPSKDPSAIARHPVERAARYAALDADLYTEIERGGERAFDSPFWQERAPSGRLEQVVRNGVPALMISGWFDVYQRGVLLNYAALQNAWARQRPVFGPMRPGQRVTPRYQVVQGPWFHNPTGLGEWIQQIHLEWFDHWLLGRRTDLATTPTPLHAFELGADRWIDAGVYPLPRAGARTLYLDEGTLTETRPSAAEAADRLPWTGLTSPCNRHPDQWSTGFGGFASAHAGFPVNPCANDDRTTAAGALTYTTEPLDRDLTLAGPISVGVHASSTTRDSELVATLESIAPDGSSYPLTTGALLGSLRARDEDASWRKDGKLLLPHHPYTRASARDLSPGRVERQDIEVYPVFARLRKGHRLRLTLGTGVTHLTPTAAQLPGLAGGVYEVRRDRAHPSFVNLPIAEPGDLPTAKRRWGECNAQCPPP